jgi:branched-chain amino acid transport system substrate-binding protein
MSHGQQPVKIGALIATTGPGAATGVPERNGLLLAQKVLNAAGGIQGRPIQLVLEDDASSPDVAVAKANSLIHTSKVKLIIGSNMIGNTIAAGGVTDRLGVPHISLTGISPAAEANRKCVFHLLPSMDMNARGLMAYAKDGLKAKRIAVLHDTGYGQVVMRSLQNLVGEYGLEFVGIEKFEIGATDVTTQASKLKASNPDALFVVSISPVPFRSVKQIRLNVPIVAALATATYETTKAMGDAADNIVHAEYLVAEDPLPHQAAFVEAFKKEYGIPPKAFEAAAWDALHIAAKALNKAGADAPSDKICEAARGAHQGAMAKVNFADKDLTGLAIGDIVYSKLTAGKFSRLPFQAK